MIPPCSLLALNESTSLSLRPLLMALQRQVLLILLAIPLTKKFGQTCDGGISEKVDNGDAGFRPPSQALLQLALHLYQQQRMAAEIEKVVVQAHAGNLQNFRPDL